MDLKQLLTEHGVRFVEGGSHRHVRDGWLGLDCPWCGDVEKYHLGVHLGSLRATCWRCGRQDLREALALILRLPAGKINALVRDIPRSPRAAFRAVSGRGRLRTPGGLGPLSEQHQGWLRRRGLDPPQMGTLWGLRGIGLSATLGWRIWVPVHLDGEVVSWTTRTIGNQASRWIHARPDEEVWPIKSLLYGWDYVRNSCIVVEGPSDVWRIGPGAVALFGVVSTASQIRLLSSVPRRVICFDNEPVAQRTARRLAEQLQAFPGETLVVELSSADPGEASNEEMAELRSYLE